jgi:hypothetical protein
MLIIRIENQGVSLFDLTSSSERIHTTFITIIIVIAIIIIIIGPTSKTSQCLRCREASIDRIDG